MLRAQGFADGLQKVFEVAQTVDSNTMTLQYVEALKEIGSSASTKFVLPLEVTKMLSGLGMFNQPGDGA